MMGDLTVVFLTIGEPYADRALESVRRQTLAAAPVVVVGSEAPFHRAFNAGVSKVRTSFFVKVDADLILDPICFARLRACVADTVGIVTGRLRDPLLGRIGSVCLYRTRCFERFGFPDSISPDTDFGARMRAAGWRRVDALARRGGPRDLWHTLGEHRPDYTPLYTFSKFRLAGARYRYRRDPYTLRSLVRRLHPNAHPAAPIALTALAHGVFLTDTRDQLRAYSADAEFEFASRFFSVPLSPRTPPTPLGDVVMVCPQEAFFRSFETGAAFGACGDTAGFLSAASTLAAAADRSWTALVALTGLCHGLFRTAVPGADAERAYPLLEGWLVGEGLHLDP